MSTTTLPSNKLNYEVNLMNVSFPSSTHTKEFITMMLHNNGKLMRVKFLSSTTIRAFLTTTLHVNES